MLNLFTDPYGAAQVKQQPWKPRPLSREEWPPNYTGVYLWRIQQLSLLRTDKALHADAWEYYKQHPGEWICHWCDTYNPRLKGDKWIPFITFERQQEFVDFVYQLIDEQENGLVEKCRDIGATWLACAISLHLFIFWHDEAVGWGSRKQELVDKLGDPDSIFEKMRLMLRRLPDIWRPKGFKPRDHATFMKLINPDNGSSVTGESGDNIGRGGRKGIYWKDESAHYERPEKIESALGDNTNVQIDISSVNGVGNVFHRRRKAGIDWVPGFLVPSGYTRVFVFRWQDHPGKDQKWYDTRRAKAEREGMLHVFAQEVDRDYSGAIVGRIIDPEWITAAIDAHYYIDALKIEPHNTWMAGLDVADGGIDRNALAVRQWVILRSIEEWGGVDTAVTAQRAIGALRPHKGIKVEYDCIGVGAGIRGEYNRLVREKIITPKDINLVPWNAGANVVEPFGHVIPDDDESPTNRDHYKNLKAQGWFALRARFFKTWRARKFGDVYPADELISLDSRGLGHMLSPLEQELAQAVRAYSQGMKIIVDKTPEGTRSPNLADAVVQAFFPAPEDMGPMTGSYSG